MKANTALMLAAAAVFGLSACQMGGNDRSGTSSGSGASSQGYPTGSTATPSGRSPGQGAGNTGTATTDTNDPNRPGRGPAGATPGTPSR